MDPFCPPLFQLSSRKDYVDDRSLCYQGLQQLHSIIPWISIGWRKLIHYYSYTGRGWSQYSVGLGSPFDAILVQCSARVFKILFGQSQKRSYVETDSELWTQRDRSLTNHAEEWRHIAYARELLISVLHWLALWGGEGFPDLPGSEHGAFFMQSRYTSPGL